MKHKFLLDENILHFAIKGINEHDRPDQTCTDLVRHIAANCHRIVLNKFLIECYWHQLNKIRGPRTGTWSTERMSFINALIRKMEKLSFEANEWPELPAGVVVPAEDVELVRIAVLIRVPIVTGDGKLRRAINEQPQLGLKALPPAEALDLAHDS